MHRLIRNTHLSLGLVFSLVWLMYALSSVQMAHPEWFPMEPEVTRQRLPQPDLATVSAERLPGALQKAAALHGDIANVRTLGDTLAFQVVRPGTVHAVSFHAPSGTLLVETQVGNF